MSRPAERGDTVIEIVLSVAILGVAFASLLGALMAGASSSRLNRQMTGVATVLSSAGEALQAAPWQSCSTAPDYGPALLGLPWPSTPTGAPPWGPGDVVITAYKWWNGSAFTASGCMGGPTTVTAASSGQSLPAPTINVASTAGFPPQGELAIVEQDGSTQFVTYIGTTPTSFLSTAGGSGTLQVGNTVSLSPNPYALQMVTVRVTSPDGSASASRDFVKGRQ